MFHRPAVGAIRRRARQSRVLLVMGASGSGKSTAVREALPDFRLADAADAGFQSDLARHGMRVIESLGGPAIIDNAERAPDLLRLLPEYASRSGRCPPVVAVTGVNPGEMVGSAMDRVSGLSVFEFGRLTVDEVFPAKPTEGWRQLWLRGGVPDAFLGCFHSWHHEYLQRLTEEVSAMAGPKCSPAAVRILLETLAVHHGQPLMLSKLMTATGLPRPVLARAVCGLADRFVIRLMHGVSATTEDNAVKTPRVYFRDSGMLHTLWGIRSDAELDAHPRRGDSWEGFVIEESLSQGADCATADEAHFVYRHNSRRIIPLARTIGGVAHACFPYDGIANPQVFRSVQKRAHEFGCAVFQVIDFSVATWGMPKARAGGAEQRKVA